MGETTRLKIFPPLAHTSGVCNSWEWARLQSGAWTSTQVSYLGAWGLSTGVITYCPPGVYPSWKVMEERTHGMAPSRQETVPGGGVPVPSKDRCNVPRPKETLTECNPGPGRFP